MRLDILLASIIISLALLFSGRFTFVMWDQEGYLIKADRLTGSYEVIEVKFKAQEATTRAATELQEVEPDTK